MTNDLMTNKIIIAGGGTGGHIFPAIAIANAILKQGPQTEILFVGAKGKMEMEKIPQAGFKIEGLDIAGFNRSSLIKNIGLPFKLVKSFVQVKRIFKNFQPTAVIGVGGYSSFPVLRFAQSKRIPSFIHESNSFAGKSNIMLGKKATKIFTASDGMEKFFPANKIRVTGNPVRSVISKATVNREEGIRFFGLNPVKKTVLSVGGSLGAKSINEALDKDMDAFENNDLQLIWQTGKPYAAKAKERAAGRTNIWAGDFISQMPDMKNSNGMINSIAFLAIVIGGVGVLNTMLMSVFERTREIGVLRALGWRRRQVLGMIIREALLLSIIGGISGIVFAIFLVFLLQQVPSIGEILEPKWNIEILLRAILVAVSLGILGGLYPAYRATRLQPIEALRYE